MSEAPDSTRSRLYLLLFCACVGSAIFLELGRMDVVSDNEGQRAAPPAEMLRTGNFVVPTLNESVYLAKPPLLYWAIVGVYRVTGVIEPWTARIPSAVCAFALALCVYLFTRKAVGEGRAVLAGIITALSPYVLERARWAEIDIPLTLALFLAVFALRSAAQTSNTRRWGLVALAGASCAAALLLKGPVLFVFIWAAWIAHAVADGDSTSGTIRTGAYWTIGALVLDLVLKSLADAFEIGGILTFPWGLAITLLVWTALAVRTGIRESRRSPVPWLAALAIGALCAAPWAIGVVREVGWDYIRSLLDEQVLERTHTASTINSGTTLYYIAVLPFLMAPWGLLLPLTLSRLQWDRNPGIYRFSVLMAWLSVAAFSLFAGKEYEYVMPVFPFFAIALAVPWSYDGDYAHARWLNAWARICRRGIGVVLVPIVVAGAAAAAVVRSNPIFILEVFVVALIGIAVFSRTFRTRPAMALIAVTWAAVLIGVLYRGDHYTGERSPKAVVEAAAELIEQGYTVEASKVYSPMAFYAGTRIEEERDPEAVKRKLLGGAPYFYLTRVDAIAAYLSDLPDEAMHLIAGPNSSKEHVLIGNRPVTLHKGAGS